MWGGGGGESLIKVGTNVWRVQNLVWAKFPKQKPNARANNCQKPNDQASFHYF